MPMCRRKLPPVVKAPLQIRHLKDFSPVCVRTCALSTPAETKPLPHCEHLKGFSPVCDLKTQEKTLIHLLPILTRIYSEILHSSKGMQKRSRFLCFLSEQD